MTETIATITSSDRITCDADPKSPPDEINLQLTAHQGFDLAHIEVRARMGTGREDFIIDADAADDLTMETGGVLEDLQSYLKQEDDLTMETGGFLENLRSYLKQEDDGSDQNIGPLYLWAFSSGSNSTKTISSGDKGTFSLKGIRSHTQPGTAVLAITLHYSELNTGNRKSETFCIKIKKQTPDDFAIHFIHVNHELAVDTFEDTTLSWSYTAPHDTSGEIVAGDTGRVLKSYPAGEMQKNGSIGLSELLSDRALSERTYHFRINIFDPSRNSPAMSGTASIRLERAGCWKTRVTSTLGTPLALFGLTKKLETLALAAFYTPAAPDSKAAPQVSVRKNNSGDLEKWSPLDQFYVPPEVALYPSALVGEHIWFFGGDQLRQPNAQTVAPASPVHEAWRISTVTGKGLSARIEAPGFSPRCGHRCLGWKNKLLVLGGISNDTQKLLGDAWLFSPIIDETTKEITLKGTLLPQAGGNPAAAFTPRGYFGACVVEDELYVIGGAELIVLPETARFPGLCRAAISEENGLTWEEELVWSAPFLDTKGEDRLLAAEILAIGDSRILVLGNCREAGAFCYELRVGKAKSLRSRVAAIEIGSPTWNAIPFPHIMKAAWFPESKGKNKATTVAWTLIDNPEYLNDRESYWRGMSNKPREISHPHFNVFFWES